MNVRRMMIQIKEALGFMVHEESQVLIRIGEDGPLHQLKNVKLRGRQILLEAAIEEVK